jgi:methionine-rich copper-binding protein CopC
MRSMLITAASSLATGPLLAAALSLAAAQASAHAFLKSATPAVGSTLQQPPGDITITFTEGVEPLFSTITVTDRAGARYDTGTPHLSGDDSHLAVALKPLAPGSYTVVWHATSTDTHKTQGRYSFTLKP